jgi:hypothetical protein
MAEIIITMFLFLAVTAISIVLFGAWIFFSIARGIIRILFGGNLKPRTIAMRGPMSRTCPNPRCKEANPPAAQFCRRCGQPLPTPQRVAVRQAAMW